MAIAISTARRAGSEQGTGALTRTMSPSAEKCVTVASLRVMIAPSHLGSLAEQHRLVSSFFNELCHLRRQETLQPGEALPSVT
jgi:hypothetical protein